MPPWLDIERGWRASRKSIASALAATTLLANGFAGRVLADTPSRPPSAGDEVYYYNPTDDYIRVGIAIAIIGLGLLAVLRPGSRRYIVALIGIGIVGLGSLIAFAAFLDFSGQHKVDAGLLASGVGLMLVGVAVVALAVRRRAKPQAQEPTPEPPDA